MRVLLLENVAVKLQQVVYSICVWRADPTTYSYQLGRSLNLILCLLIISLRVSESLFSVIECSCILAYELDDQ